MRRALLVVTVAILLGTIVWLDPAVAHVTATVGPVRLSMGWLREPALTGLENAVQLQATDETGAPIGDIGGSLVVEVSFNEEQVVLPLVPSARAGEVQAVVVPTRPGIYSLHARGKLRGQDIDIDATCGESTFSCVVDASEVQFPSTEPSAAQLADRLDREHSRAEKARSEAARAQGLAIGAIVVAVTAFAFAATRARRAPRPS
ncbi:MAG: hypothetical protein ACRD12_07780 [Acidimicrobiales bacterium]